MIPSEQNTEQDILTSKKVLEMLTVANEFCLFLEKAEDRTGEEILWFLQKLIPLLYLKGALLPDIPVTDENAVEHYVTEEQWEEMFNTLRAKFGNKDIFFFIDHHEQSHADPIRASLAENMTDIYQDMKDFVLLYQNPLKSFRENAVRDCKNLFENRTGFRLVNSMKIIHYILFISNREDNFSESL